MPELVNIERFLLNGLVVGPAGDGKTSLLATAADVEEMAPVLFLDIEGGTLSVAHRQDIWKERIKTVDQFESVFWKLANGAKEYAEFKSVVVDSGTELASMGLEETVSDAFKKGGNRESRDDVQLQDYGKNTTRQRRLFRWFRDLDKHVLITALPQVRYPQPPASATVEDRKRFDENVRRGLIKPLSIGPAFTEKLGGAIIGFVDFAWYLHRTPDGKRVLLTEKQGPVGFCKTRGARFAEALGGMVEVEPGNPGPTIKGLPAMKYIYNLYAQTQTMGKKGDSK